MIITNLIIFVSAILVAISAHEMMHAVSGYWLGDDTAREQGRITLNPLAHIDPIMTVVLPVFLALTGAPVIGAARPVPFNPSRLRWGEYGVMLVALAGPLTNLLLAVVGVIAFNLVGGIGWPGDISRFFALMNFGFFLFNMIPLPPLDGSRVLYVFAPDGVRNLMDRLEQFGVILVIILFIVVLSLSPDFNPLIDALNWLESRFLVRS